MGFKPNYFRYVKTFLTLKPSVIFNQGWIVFTQLRYLNFNLALVADIIFHKKTLYYLRRGGFYTVGTVPINYNQLLVDFALPISSDSYSTQFFTLTFIRSLKRTALRLKYNHSYGL